LECGSETAAVEFWKEGGSWRYRTPRTSETPCLTDTKAIFRDRLHAENQFVLSSFFETFIDSKGVV